MSLQCFFVFFSEGRGSSSKRKERKEQVVPESKFLEISLPVLLIQRKHFAKRVNCF